MDDYSVLSTFHGAGLKILRLHTQWDMVSYYRVNAQLKQWKLVLDTIFSELSPKMTLKEKDAAVKLRLESARAITNYYRVGKSINPNVSASDEAYIALDQYEIILRSIEDKHGLGSPNKEIFDPTRGM